MTQFICQPCRDRRHRQCRGGNWCDCAHQPVALPLETRRHRRGEG
jgi:hypothetical protein